MSYVYAVTVYLYAVLCKTKCLIDVEILCDLIFRSQKKKKRKDNLRSFLPKRNVMKNYGFSFVYFFFQSSNLTI